MTPERDDEPPDPRVGWLSSRLWGLHGLVVVAVAFCVFMGLWQMGVYDNRRDHERADQQDVPTAPLAEVLGPDDPFTGTANHRPVTFTGTYGATDEQVWVSGKDRAGADGYWLVAPVLTDGVPAAATGDPVALLVVRGWSASAGDLPEVTPGDVTFDAVLQTGDARGGGLDPATRVMDGVRIPVLVNEVPYDLYGGYGIVTSQDPADSAGLDAVTPPEPEVAWTAGLRNLAYAIQWWIFGAFALFMWWRMCTDIRRGQAAEQRAPRRPEPEQVSVPE